MAEKRYVDFVLFVVLLCVFSWFAFVAYDGLDIQFLAFTSGDELPQFRQLNHILNGFLNLDLEGMFRFEFYNYGYIYYLLNVLVTAPFNLYEKYEWAIYAPRLLNAFFAILNLWMVYKISNLYLSSRISLWIVIFCLCLPGFWAFGYVFKPDTFQAFFVLLSVYYLCLDSLKFKKNYYLGIVSLGMAIGVAKFQAVMFFPLICFYAFLPFWKTLEVKSFVSSCLESLKGIALGLCIWVITNPYLLHPKGVGIQVWWNMFVANMHSNATNHGTYIDLSVWDKIINVLLGFFINPLLMVLGFVALGLIFIKNFKNPRFYIFWTIFVAFAISILYLLLAVNKDWGIYYVSSIYLGILLLIPLCMVFQARNVLLIAFVVQLGGIFLSGVQKNFLKHRSDISAIQTKSQELEENLAPLLTQYKDPKICTSWVNFSYLLMGLKYSNLYQIFGTIAPYVLDEQEFQKRFPYKDSKKYFKQCDVVIIEKRMYEKNCSAQSLEDLSQRLSCETLKNMTLFRYQLKKESENFLIYVLEEKK